MKKECFSSPPVSCCSPAAGSWPGRIPPSPTPSQWPLHRSPLPQLQSRRRSPRTGSGPDSLLPDEVIDLNAADAYDLDRLPGIGPAKAEAILVYREEHGPFQSVDDLLAVSGIGEVTLEDLRPYVTADS